MTHAGLILFGTQEAVTKRLAQAEVVFEYRSSDASGPAQDRKEFRQGFFCYFDDLWHQINLRNDKQDFQDGLFVTPIATFNERPVREAILNAVSHRNYQLGGSIFIRQFPRRLEIDSPGGLPLGITLDNILDRQNPRNRRIAEILTRCGLVERSGQGMNLIYEDLIRQSKPAPDFSRTDQYQVGLTLHGTVQDPQFCAIRRENLKGDANLLQYARLVDHVGGESGGKTFKSIQGASCSLDGFGGYRAWQGQYSDSIATVL